MEPTEKARSGGFGVWRRAKMAWGAVVGGSRRKKIQLAGSQRMASGCILSLLKNPKKEIRVKEDLCGSSFSGGRS
jgi:hypothetical protein